MKKIKMVDLTTQYLRIREDVHSAIQDVIDSASFINGPSVSSFQQKFEAYLSIKHVVPCGNGTDALQIALMAFNLQPGDEVITPSFTFIATAEVIALLKLKPVMVDVLPDTFNIDPVAVEAAITPKTKAIIPVHLFGQCADMDSIMKIAEKHNLIVIEDACQATGAEYRLSNGQIRKAGTIGHIGCTSFFPSKNLGAFGDGGALFTDDDVLAKKIRSIVNHGMSVRYYHDDIGVNSRLDSIQAAILSVKLKYLPDYIKARQMAADFYDHAFSGIKELKIPFRSSASTHVFHQYTLVTKGINRNSIVEYLASKDIPSMIYYPVPLHLQNAYAYLGYHKGELPVSEHLAESVFSLPMHTELTEDQLKYITSSVLEFINKK